jgi:hypothetical protein
MRTLEKRPVLATLLAALLVTACRANAPIPPGAQQVHVVDSQPGVRLAPATVHAGDVYIVLDGPRQSVVLVERKRTAAETPGPMSDDDLARLARADTEGMSLESISVGCSAEQRAESRGQTGYCGNVYKLVLAAGKYAFLTDPPEGLPQPIAPGSMAVLDVTP